MPTRAAARSLLNVEVLLNRQIPTAARLLQEDAAAAHLDLLGGQRLGAGPATTSPVAMLYWLPWHGQSMVPLLTWLTMQPMCVQTALNALNSPAVAG